MTTRGYLKDFSGSLAGSGSQVIIPANSSAEGLRSFFYFQNQGAASMSINFAASLGAAVTAVAGEPSITVAAGASVQFDHFVPQGAVSVIGTSTQKFVCKTCGD